MTRPSVLRSGALALLVGLCVPLLGACTTVTQTREVPAGDVRSPTPEQPSSDSGRGYRFMHVTEDGSPVRWSTCDPIRYVVRPGGGPDDATDVVRDSVRRLSEATGLEFSFEGTTDEPPSTDRPLYQPGRYGETFAPVLVAWSDSEEFPQLQGRAAGYGGPVYVQPGGGAARYVSGLAVVDVEGVAATRGGDTLRAVVLHELAHVMGLAHVKNKRQLMNPVQYGEQVTDFRGGDLDGLGKLGAGECYEPIDPDRFAQ